MTVVKSGQNVGSATGANILLNSNIPFTKLDTTKINSFQTVVFTFKNEPTQPTVATPKAETLLYSFPHGYSYIPSTWFSWQNPIPVYSLPPVSPGQSTYTYYPYSDDYANLNVFDVVGEASLFGFTYYNDISFGTGVYTVASLYTQVDTQNVNLYMLKQGVIETSGNTYPAYIVAGQVINMRFYVFAEPAGTTSY